MTKEERRKLALAVFDHYGLTDLTVVINTYSGTIDIFNKAEYRVKWFHHSIKDDDFKVAIERFAKERYDKTSV